MKIADTVEGQKVWVLVVEDDGIRIDCWTATGEGKEKRLTRGYSSMYTDVFPTFATQEEAVAAASRVLDERRRGARA